MSSDIDDKELYPIFKEIMQRVLDGRSFNKLDKERLAQETLDKYNPKHYGEKRTYPQNWPIYYAACRTEKLAFFKI